MRQQRRKVLSIYYSTRPSATPELVGSAPVRVAALKSCMHLCFIKAHSRHSYASLMHTHAALADTCAHLRVTYAHSCCTCAHSSSLARTHASLAHTCAALMLHLRATYAHSCTLTHHLRVNSTLPYCSFCTLNKCAYLHENLIMEVSLPRTCQKHRL